MVRYPGAVELKHERLGMRDRPVEPDDNSWCCSPHLDLALHRKNCDSWLPGNSLEQSAMSPTNMSPHEHVSHEHVFREHVFC
jgi:hypothetical protein